MQVKIKRPAPKVCTLELTAREAEVLRRLVGAFFFDHSGDNALDGIFRRTLLGSPRSATSVPLDPSQSNAERTRIVNAFLAADTAEATVDVNVGDEILANGQWRRVEAIVGGSAVYATGSGAGVCLPGNVQDVRKAEPVPATDAPAMAWPWPAGTQVRLLPGAYGYDAENTREVYTLWHDGTDCPPVVRDGDDVVCFASEGCVERAE